MRREIEAYWGSSRGEHHRYRSWEHCFAYFQGVGPENLMGRRDEAALQLAFYLASWGMYRGSSFLLQHAYTVHRDVIDVLAEARFRALWSHDFGANPDDTLLIPNVLELVMAVREAYLPFVPKGGTTQPTDTLLTKVVLGTVGCLPAVDRYFIDGFKSSGNRYSHLNRAFIERILEFCEANLDELTAIQHQIRREAQVLYPLMKLVDMCFWQLGFEKDAGVTRGSAPESVLTVQAGAVLLRRSERASASLDAPSDAGGTFWVYENWAAEKKAVIHRTECGHCQDGQGSHRGKHGERNGRWHGPFEGYESAKVAAEMLPGRAIRDCSICLKPSAHSGV